MTGRDRHHQEAATASGLKTWNRMRWYEKVASGWRLYLAAAPGLLLLVLIPHRARGPVIGERVGAGHVLSKYATRNGTYAFHLRVDGHFVTAYSADRSLFLSARVGHDAIVRYDVYQDGSIDPTNLSPGREPPVDAARSAPPSAPAMLPARDQDPSTPR